ncbi:MAG: 4Fe-4S ferredoxin-type protein [Dehalococcoidales bacterium]|nr:4Fe-4S ferredoxin-type protein [Dehalococcoidales bacterium]
MVLTTVDSTGIRTDPAHFLNQTIKEYIATSPDNIMPGFAGEPIWDEPLVGFADGDDPIFQEYKEIIGQFHLTPREVMERHLGKIARGYARPPHISVISIIVPSTRATRESMRKETQVCSLRWNHTRHYGQEVINRLSRYLVAVLESAGYHAIAPDLERFFEVKRDDPKKVASTWSQRHIAYAAGLGTFSLNDALITPRGIAIRAGSIVCNLAVKPTPRLYQNHLENCLFYRDGKCGKCIQRCPAGALSEKGHDKEKCRNYLNEGMQAAARELGRNETFVGGYMGCGFCQTRVPCEEGIPPSASRAS